jgi:hypothetical protein
MNTRHNLGAEEASRLAVTATVADLEHWGRSAAVNGQIGLADLVRVLDVLRSASQPGQTTSALMAS